MMSNGPVLISGSIQNHAFANSAGCIRVYVHSNIQFILIFVRQDVCLGIFKGSKLVAVSRQCHEMLEQV